MLKEKYLRVLLMIFLAAWLIFFILQKIDLSTSDLARHLKNGELLLKGNFALLKTNFYSYTQPDFPFLNHHWAGGVLFYLFWRIGGFAGSHLLFIVLTLVTFLLFFRLAEKQSDIKIAAILAVILIPLIAQRKEVRPEVFAYFFSALFFLILTYHRKGIVSGKWLWLLPFLQILWLNIHIYFIFGPVLIVVFLLEKILLPSRSKKQALKSLILVFVFTVLATLLNPAGIAGALYPLRIFGNYGYRIIGNQSVWFLEGLGFIKNPNFTLVKIIFAMLFLSFILVFIRKRKKFSLVNFCLGTGFGVMAFWAIRNFTIFGFFALPIIAHNIKLVFPQEISARQFLPVFLVAVVFLLAAFAGSLPISRQQFGFGLAPGNEAAAQFFKSNNIQGPIFNNYDIGGYLIYYLYPKERVFVDNRPEAYSTAFFQETYIPLQNNEELWQKEEMVYNFNVIFFSHQDVTPWAQKFLVARVQDDTWAPVFADQYNIIFLKRNDRNQPIIEKYEIARENFGII